MDTHWIHDEILDGLSVLLCLGLDRTPASDLIAGTAMAWTRALADGRVWERGLDAPRFRAAFLRLSKNRRSWPAPADFLEAIPPRNTLAITKQPIKAAPDRARRAALELADLLGLPPEH